MENREHPEPQLNRRKMIGLLGAAAIGSLYYFGIYRPSQHQVVKYSIKMMGTIVNFTLIGKNERECQAALQEAIKHMKDIGHSINWYDPNSPLGTLNRKGVLHNPDKTLLTVTKMAVEMSRLTEGAFDPTVLPLLGLFREIKKTGKLPPDEAVAQLLPLVNYKNVIIEEDAIRYAAPGMGMTLDGIGKGYVVDQGIAKLKELGYTNMCIEAGGDLMVSGNKEKNKPWTIGIRNPRPEKDDGEQFIVELHDKAIATSGDYMQAYTDDRKYYHIINPATGFSPPELASASIIAPTVAKADGLATAAMVMGDKKAIALLDTLPDCEGFLIDKELKTYTSKNFFQQT